ncbi:methionyl-tRNA formyltransferase [Natronosalvus rutilus]|uniref:Formyl transferase N-terminal domain-containing protein n=1 Tax=Natronosalvus rutilus TaxID=2953753 RepID=A0A9E7NDM4_9EURY|nr:formyltransferase family protein [Natronosalvus rutilus]UTF54802.1 hypothetical protein NGM29_05920 [Natronosalvus rutilus]
MNVLLLTMNEPMYMPRYLEPLLDEYSDDISNVVIAPHPGEGLLTTARMRYRMFGPAVFLRYGFHFAGGKFLGALPYTIQKSLMDRYYSVPSLCKANGIPVQTEIDVNSEEFRSEVREQNIDLILSISCGQKLGPELLSIPEYGAINLHGSLLPNYRGRATAFWVLYHDEDHSGVTAHYMNEALDEGDIVLQRKFPISDDDTMHDVYNKVVKTGGELAKEVIDRVEAGEIETQSNPVEDGGYYTLPGPKERHEFRKQGNKFR